MNGLNTWMKKWRNDGKKGGVNRWKKLVNDEVNEGVKKAMDEDMNEWKEEEIDERIRGRRKKGRNEIMDEEMNKGRNEGRMDGWRDGKEPRRKRSIDWRKDWEWMNGRKERKIKGTNRWKHKEMR